MTTYQSQSTLIRQRFSTLAAVTASNPVLLEGEKWNEKDSVTGLFTGRTKTGKDGTVTGTPPNQTITGTAFNNLPFDPSGTGGGGGGGASLSDATPQPLGVAAAGTAATASRGDHRHAMPTAAQVGADATGTAVAAVIAHVAAVDPHAQYLTPDEADGRYRLLSAALTDSDIPAVIARDAEVTAAVSDHESAADPHPGYLTPAEGNAAYAPIGQGVTNGNNHDHSGGDGAQIAYSSLSGLPTLGTAAATDATAYATAAQGAKADAADYLASLAGSEIVITTTATATISRQHLISGTTSDYTVTLPAASGSAGKFISFRINDAATRRFTIKGDGSELINGQNTRIMWAGESAVLYCDGIGWRKLSGVTKPMLCQISATSVQSPSIPNTTVTDVTLSRVDVDNTGLMADTANSRIRNFRPGQYKLMGHLMWNVTTGSATRLIGQIFNSNTSTALTGHEMNAFATGCFPSCQPYALVTLVSSSTIKLQAYMSANVTNVYGHPTTDTTQLIAIEVPSW